MPLTVYFTTALYDVARSVLSAELTADGGWRLAAAYWHAKEGMPAWQAQCRAMKGRGKLKFIRKINRKFLPANQRPVFFSRYRLPRSCHFCYRHSPTINRRRSPSPFGASPLLTVEFNINFDVNAPTTTRHRPPPTSFDLTHPPTGQNWAHARATSFPAFKADGCHYAHACLARESASRMR